MFLRIEADLEASVEGPSGMGGPARESFDLHRFGPSTLPSTSLASPVLVCVLFFGLGREELK